MAKYAVRVEGGVDVNGSKYEQGHIFEFDAVPEYVQPLIEDGSIVEVEIVSEEPESSVESPKGEGAVSLDGSEEVGSAQVKK